MAMAQPPERTPDELGLEAREHPIGAQGLARGKAVSWRSVLLCLILLPINAYWVVQMEVIRYSAHPTTISLFFNTIFILLCLSLVNRGVTRLAPRWALRRGEMLL